MEPHDQQPRINTINDLFKVAIQYQRPNDEDDSTDRPQPLDEERRRFLEQALLQNTVNVADILKQGIERLQTTLNEMDLNQGTISEQEQERALETLDNLLQWVGQIDFARDFLTLGGYPVIARLLQCNNQKLIVATFDLCAELLQNNVSTQKTVLDNGLLGVLIGRLQREDFNDSNDQRSYADVKAKAFYCLSSLLRGNDVAIEKFIQSDGISVLVQLMQSEMSNERLCTKVSFFLSSLTATHPFVLNLLLERGFVDIFVAILHGESNQSHEFLLSILNNGCLTNEEFVQECCRPELGLKSLLHDKINFCKDKEEHLETLSVAQNLLKTCFSTAVIEESDR